MPRVRFPHAAHARVACVTCHHMGYNDDKVMICASSGCHDGPMALKPDQSRDPMHFRRAFHGEAPSCVNCHTVNRQEGKAAGPVDCKGCHKAPSPQWAEEEKS